MRLHENNNKVTLHMKRLSCLLGSLVVAGCAASGAKYTLTKEEALQPRVTRTSILSHGGICNEEDICTDSKNRQDYDCTAESSCFPKGKH
jgi:hypothetical protein